MANELELFEKLVGFFHGAGWASDWTAESFMAWMHSHRLHLMTDADLRVLEAMAKARLTYDRHHGRHIFEFSEDELDVCEAELARRGEKP